MTATKRHKATKRTAERIPAEFMQYADPTRSRGTVDIAPMFLRGVRIPLAFAVEGGCLAPLGIVDGDTAIVDGANRRPRHGEIVACTLNGNLLLKAYLIAGGAGERLGYVEGERTMSILVKPDDELVIIGTLATIMPTGRRAWPTERPEWVSRPVLRGRDLKELPYWQADFATGEWVPTAPDGTELQRRPITSTATENEVPE